MALTVAELRAVFSADTRGLDQGLGRVDKSLKRSEGFIGRAGATMTGFLGASVIQSGTRAIAAGFGFAKDAAIGFNDTMDRATTGFTTMLGSGRKARVFLDQLKAFATKTPFEFPELVTNSQKLLAMGFTAKDVIPTLTAVGDATAGLGGDPGTMNQIIRAMGQMQAKGKVAAGEMTQLAEAGVGAWDMLAKKLGVTVPEAMSMVEKGQVSAAQAIPALVGGMQKQFGGLMDAQTKTWMGALSNIKDTAVQVIAGIVRPQFEMLRDKAVDVAAWLGEGHIQKYLAEIGDALQGETATQALDGMQAAASNFVGVVEPIAAMTLPLLVTGFQALGNFLLNQVIPAVVAVTGFLSEHETVTKALVFTIGALVLVTQAHAAAMAVAAAGGMLAWLKGTQLITSVTKVWTAVQWALNASLLANPLVAVAALVAALVVAFVIAYKKSETFRNIVNGALNAVKDVAQSVGRFFARWAAEIVAELTSAWTGIRNAAASTWAAIRATASVTWGAIVAVITGMVAKVLGAVDFLQSLPGKVGGFFQRAKEAAAEKLTALITLVRGVPGRVVSGLGDLGSTLYNAGIQLITGFVDGIQDKIGDAVDAVKDGLGKIKGLLPGSPIKWGPLKPWNTGAPGKQLMGLLAKGITEGSKLSEKAAEKAMERLKKKLDTKRGVLADLRSQSKSLAESVAGAFVDDPFSASASEAVKDEDGKVTTPAKSALQNFLAKITGNIGNIGMARGAADTFKGWGGTDEFVRALFSSGNTDLVRDLLADGAAGFLNAQSLFEQQSAAAAALGKKVAQEVFSEEIGKATEQVKLAEQAIQALRGDHKANKDQKDTRREIAGMRGDMAGHFPRLAAENRETARLMVRRLRGRGGGFDEFDSGGWLLPGVPVNNTGRPEAVLTPEESAAFVELAKSYARGETGQPAQQHFHIKAASSRPRDVARAAALAVRMV